MASLELEGIPQQKENMMLYIKKQLLILLIFFLPHLVFAEIIATCENPKGYEYFAFAGNVPKSDSGWHEGGFKGGIYRLIQDANGGFDVVFTTKTGQFLSATNDGGSVAPFSLDENQISIIVLYMGSVVETFSFINDNAGINKLILTQTKTKFIPKIAAYETTCSQLDLYKIK
tara:strand:- start:198 stop:716 length:519 start_codon:yes stop_codon:yes gene_type:complete